MHPSPPVPGKGKERREEEEIRLKAPTARRSDRSPILPFSVTAELFGISSREL